MLDTSRLKGSDILLAAKRTRDDQQGALSESDTDFNEMCRWYRKCFCLHHIGFCVEDKLHKCE